MHKLIVLFTFSCLLVAQSDFEKFKQAEAQAFQDFLSKEDKQFISFLKNKWIDVDLEKGKKRYKKEKPTKLPVLRKETPLKRKKIERKIKDSPKKRKTNTFRKPKNEERIKVTPAIKRPVYKKKSMRFDYFGLESQVPFVDGLKQIRFSSTSNQTIAAFWQEFAAKEKSELINFIQRQFRLNGFSDYESYVYSYKLASELYPDEKRQRLATWYFLTKLGYRLKLAYAADELFLLIPIVEQVYGYSYFSFKAEQNRFYAFTPDSKSYQVKKRVFTYKQNYPNASRLFHFSSSKTVHVSDEVREKHLSFSYKGQKHNLAVRYNEELIKFYKYFPQLTVDVYVNSGTSRFLQQSLLPQLQKLIDGKSEAEAANLIIRFVQTAFQYKTDQKQFRREKFLFPDETIHYPASDCEDRSILYAYLIRNLLNLNVVGLWYPGHIATAVQFSQKQGGDHLLINGSSYLICDPTYINANIGMAMPQFKNTKAKIIQLD